MDQAWPMVVLILAGGIGIAVTLVLGRRHRQQLKAGAPEPSLAIGVDDLKACPACGAANLIKDETCLSCGKPLPA